ESLLEDPTGALAQILLYHVVGAKALSTDLSDGQMITTLNGDSVTVKIMDGKVYIDNAMVTVADIEADNGVVHVIDAVIVPASTVLDIIVGSPVHNTLEAAIFAAELDGALAGEGPFTVFAPTDEAFAALPAGTVESLLEDPTGALAQILLYHVAGAKALSTDLSDGQMITTLNGDSVTVKIMDGMVYIDNAMVIVADLMADNGVVHVVDAVILPTYTVWDIIMASPAHNTLEAAVKAAGLDGALAGEGPFTVFAPTDEAFAALPAGTVESLLEDPTGALAQILLYHVAGTKALSTDLSDGQMITTLQGTDITVKITNGNVYINEAMVTVADLEADNGVVHVIDAVLLPVTTGIQDKIVEVEGVSVYPNPANEYVNVSYKILNESNVTLEMYDMTGKQVGYENQGYTYEGEYTTEFPVNTLQSGMYLLIINTGNSQIANKVRVVK
ncbi:MAG: fasciclin domain-containing protein, partial [Bacteroidales bacterium]